jgi:DNA-binding NtrC family response regulator
VSGPGLTTSLMDPGSAEWRKAVEGLVTELEAQQATQAAFNTVARQLLTALAGEPPAPAGPVGRLDLAALLAAYERSLVLWALAKTGGLQLDAARLLGVQPSTLNEKMKRLCITRSRQAAAIQRAPAEPPRRRLA